MWNMCNLREQKEWESVKKIGLWKSGSILKQQDMMSGSDNQRPPPTDTSPPPPISTYPDDTSWNGHPL